MSAVLFAKVELDPVTDPQIGKCGVRSSGSTYQSKSKGIDSGPMLAEKTLLNSSNVMVPELSL